MGDIYGGKAKMVQIPVPVGKKIKGLITELKLSQKFESLIDIKIEFAQYKKRSDDGKREFTKQAFYGIPVDWSEKNKAGRLLYALFGKFPQQEQVNWTKALLGREVDCIFEDIFDDQTGESKGQKIKWIGKVGSSEGDLADQAIEKVIQVEDKIDDFDEKELQPDENLPF